MVAPSTADFARHLGHHRLISADLLDRGQGRPGGPALRQLRDASDLTPHDFAEQVAGFFGTPLLTLSQLVAASSLAAGFSSRFLRDSAVFPFEIAEGRAGLAVFDPTDAAARRAVEIVLGRPVALHVASFEDIATVLGQQLEAASEPEGRTASDAVLGEDVESLRDLASGAPVVRALSGLLETAVELRASDIHLEPSRSGLVVRMRVDGLLRPTPTPAGILPQALMSRIKILSGLNIAERRLPQDGAARVKVDRTEIDIRVATMPTQNGEAAVIRLLPRDRGLLEIGKLGLAPRDDATLRRLLDLSHGMVVVTGPTGSGKTTTLATALSVLNTPARKILTIEDPVEYEIQGINQSQVKPAIGLTFAAALRAFVRQDPDVIMVGEVRDPETAGISIHAALTGHLVLTTLHTETAAAAIPRLLDLGVESFLLRSTLRAIVAQRLVRVLCDRCKTRRPLTAEDLGTDPRYKMLGFRPGEPICEPRGCERCGGTGYRGRVGIFEILEIDEAVAPLVGPHADGRTIDRAAIEAGMTTMLDDAVRKCRAGITTVAEVFRVTTVR